MVAFLCPVPFIKSGYRPNAVNFNGSTNYLRRNASMSVGNGPTGIFFCWFKTSNTNIDQFLLSTNNNKVWFKLTNGKPNFRVESQSNGANYLEFITTSAYNNGAWHSLLISWNTNFSAGNKICNFYVDDTAVAGTKTDTGAAFSDVGNVSPDTHVALDWSQSNIFTGDLAQLYWAPNQYSDFSTASNRRAYVTGGNKPVDMTSIASSALVFCNSPAASIATNSGGGGNFGVVGGTFSDASTNPG